MKATLLRNALVPFLAFEARSDSVRRDLLAMGRTYSGFGSSGRIDATAADAALVEAALAVAVQELGMPFVEHLWRQLQASTDAVFRHDVLMALSRATDPTVADWVRDRTLSPQLPADEAWQLYMSVTQQDANADALWAWQKANLPRLAQRMSPFLHGMLVSTLGASCSAADRDRVRAAFTPLIGEFEGGRRALDDALEQIEICTAYVHRQKNSARSFAFD
jgi:cytosol alanyl aminopeptidase